MPSPVPYELASSAASRPCGSRLRPDTSAISTTATPSRTANAVSTGSPVGPSARTETRSNPAARAASTVPSPPSATGARTTGTCGVSASIPAAIRSATSRAVREPLNLSGAARTAMLAPPVGSVQEGDGGWGVVGSDSELLELDDVVQLSAHGDV